MIGQEIVMGTNRRPGGIADASGSHVPGRDVTLTGSHVIWGGKPRKRRENGSRAQGTGSHVIWDGKPLTSRENGSRAQGGEKPLTSGEKGSRAQGGENRGASRAQCPKSNSGTGGGIKSNPWVRW